MHLRMQIFWEEGIVIGPTHVIYSNQAEYGVVDLVVQSVTLHLNLCPKNISWDHDFVYSEHSSVPV